MAVDGRKLGKSIYQGSDEVYDIPCAPCAKEGKNVAAFKHCVECDENLCKTCLDHHNKFAVMRGHQLLDKVKSPSGKTPELPSQRCEKHGKLIDVYCPGHDKVGCSTCMIVEHSGCQGIHFIPDIATETETSGKIKLLKGEIGTLKSRFEALKQTKQKDRENGKNEKDQLLKEIRLERKKINDQLDNMEAELIQEVDTIFQTKLQHVESSLKEVNAKIALLQENLDKINAAENENASERYVQLKCANEKTKLARKCLENLETPCKAEKMRFDPYSHVSDSRCNTIGKIIHFQDIKVECNIDELNVRTANDKNTCNITDMCMCKDGSIAMIDLNNKCIKILNESFNVIDSLATKGTPLGICQIDPSLLAVTLINERKVQFLSKQEEMKLTGSFKVGDRCRRIAYNDGLIYVCCGGFKKREDEGVGHLEVYTVSGELLTSYYGGIECPKDVSISRSTLEIFVIDGYKGIIKIDQNKSMKYIKDKAFSNHQRICKISSSQYCIASYSSSNFLLISCDGKDQEELLVENGAIRILGMCFDNKTSKLIVSSENNDEIKVYYLKIGGMS